ncbi:hemolysin activation/secretion protein [Glaciimonas immobilis]|uniref:Hemolysin activation/secretion protein n=1 Tax=Glaciimonas immobilis TaxID=728004 RepID=A0A840S1E6_9BURK|nr:hemolysin activation/secretion protein [Glaciimonas immobilis]
MQILQGEMPGQSDVVVAVERARAWELGAHVDNMKTYQI